MGYVFALVTVALSATAAKVAAAMKTTGATPERPFEVTTASVVEAQATSAPCVV